MISGPDLGSRSLLVLVSRKLHQAEEKTKRLGDDRKMIPSGRTNIAMENPPFEDVFPIQDGDFPLLCLFTGGYPVGHGMFAVYRGEFTVDGATPHPSKVAICKGP